MSLKSVVPLALMVLSVCAAGNALAAPESAKTPPALDLLDVNVVNHPDNPVPVEIQQTTPTPVFLSFSLTNSSDWESDYYQVPDGQTLEITLVGAGLSGDSGDTDNVFSAVRMNLRFPDGEGGTCNNPNEELCRITIPLVVLNNSDTGANMSSYFPSVVQPASIRIPSGATFNLNLFPKISGPGPVGFLSVQLSGVLEQTGQP